MNTKQKKKLKMDFCINAKLIVAQQPLAIGATITQERTDTNRRERENPMLLRRDTPRLYPEL